MYIVSGCLLGICCKYNGGSNDCTAVKDFLKNKSYVVVCPEMMAGLEAPRPPAEIIGDKVIDKEGNDITDAFHAGAKIAYQTALDKAKAQKEELELAILKARSPSCGSGMIYDGTFTGRMVDGDGFFVRLLKENGIDVISEDSLMER